ncbi:MAG: hypothetical protein ABI251_14020, partial [Mycobacteriaceae bacterium]
MMAQESGAKPADTHVDAVDFNTENGEVVETVTQETAHKAQRVVAAHSADTTECSMLLAMLGVGPESA